LIFDFCSAVSLIRTSFAMGASPFMSPVWGATALRKTTAKPRNGHRRPGTSQLALKRELQTRPRRGIRGDLFNSRLTVSTA
jgi:hypothetical protein